MCPDHLGNPSAITNAFASFLAARIAYVLTRSSEKEERAEKMFKRDWREHRAVDGGGGGTRRRRQACSQG